MSEEKEPVQATKKTVTVENTTDAAIVVALSPKSEPSSVVVPRAIKKRKESGEGVDITCGTAQFDSDELAALRKTSKVVTSYFSSGALRVVSAGPPAGSQTAFGPKKG